MGNVIYLSEVIEKLLDSREQDERHIKIFGQYQRVIDESIVNFDPNVRECNIMFLRQIEAYSNDALRVRGYLFLNEVYRALGLSETLHGQLVGWIYDEKCPRYVNFEIYENTEKNYINIDFNVDGVILDKVFETERAQ